MKKLICASLLVLTACATAPEKVKPSYVAPSKFSGMSCPGLRHQQNILVAKVNTLSKSQRNARNGDIVGVALIGLPISSIAGADKEKELSRARGELLAVGEKIKSRGC
jgi:starvation-inducible outer membrane lipoprotein